jgi:NAD(P) transhydrogenase subunit alpha
VKIVGVANMAGAIAADSSALYARNLVNLSALLLSKEGAFAPQWDDEILKAAVVLRDGAAPAPPAA